MDDDQSYHQSESTAGALSESSVGIWATLPGGSVAFIYMENALWLRAFRQCVQVRTDGFRQRVVDAEHFLTVTENRLEQQERLGVTFISVVEGEVDTSFNGVFVIIP